MPEKLIINKRAISAKLAKHMTTEITPPYNQNTIILI